MTGTTTGQTSLPTATDSDDAETYLTTSLTTGLQTVADKFDSTTGHTHNGSGQGGPLGSGSVTAAMIANRTDSVQMNIGAFTVRTGSPALAGVGTNTRYRAWAFDAASIEDLLGECVLSARFVGATALTIKLWWTNLGAGAGNVVWRVIFKAVGDTNDLNSSGAETITDNTIAAPAQNILKISTHTATLSPAAGVIVPFIIQRLASDAADTLANDAGLVAVEIDYTADS